MRIAFSNILQKDEDILLNLYYITIYREIRDRCYERTQKYCLSYDFSTLIHFTELILLDDSFKNVGLYMLVHLF